MKPSLIIVCNCDIPSINLFFLVYYFRFMNYALLSRHVFISKLSLNGRSKAFKMFYVVFVFLFISFVDIGLKCTYIDLLSLSLLTSVGHFWESRTCVIIISRQRYLMSLQWHENLSLIYFRTHSLLIKGFYTNLKVCKERLYRLCIYDY